MSRSFRFRPQIEEDLSDAFRWYEGKEKELGDYFLSTFYSRVMDSVAHPEIYHLIYGNFRRILLAPFPYAVYFQSYKDELIFVLVIHCARSPKLLKDLLAQRKST